jgi:hypothetical protein
MSRCGARVLPPKQAGGQASDCRAIPALLRSPVATGEDLLAREQRKLAAILAADVVSYSRLMGRGESGTLARLPNAAADLGERGGRIARFSCCPRAQPTWLSPTPDERALLAGYDHAGATV